MSSNGDRIESLWRRIGRCLVLTFPLAIVCVVMRKCGVPVAAVVSFLLLIPVAAAFIPRAAARWRPWGSVLCFVCPINAMLAFVGPDDPPMSSMIVAGLAAGIAAMLLEIVTGRIVRRSASAS